MKAGASLVLLDSTRKKLIHTSSWGLPQFYLRKGVLDADKSLSEVLTGQPVVITDVARDSRVQYPEIAATSGHCFHAGRTGNVRWFGCRQH